MFVYILSNSQGTLSIGVISDLGSRMAYHAGTSRASFAHRYNCDHLIYFEHVADYTSAIMREKQLKGWRREKKIALIAGVNPQWHTILLG